jgi:CheY-like chemotaxis protein
MQISEIGAYFEANQGSDLWMPFRSVMVIDDVPDAPRMFCNLISHLNPNTLCCGCVLPRRGLDLFEECFYDVLVCDMKMPEIRGDQVINRVKEISPATFTIAMSAVPAEMGCIAGSCHPDVFIAKDMRTMNEIVETVGRNLKRNDAGFAELIEKGADVTGKKLHWRKTEKIKKRFGYTRAKLLRARGLTHALALLKLCTKMSLEEISTITGFSSGSHLKRTLSKLMPKL